MKSKLGIISVIISAVVFTILFYKHPLGLNLLIFELIYFTWILVSKQLKFDSKNMITATAGLLVTAFFSVFTYSVFTYIMNFMSMILFVGMLVYPEVKSYINAFALSVSNVFRSQKQFMVELLGLQKEEQQKSNIFRRSLIFAIPLFIVFVFITLYRSSNPVFDNLTIRFARSIADGFNYIFKDIDFLIIATFLLGLMVSNYLLFRNKNQHIINIDNKAIDELCRTKPIYKRLLSTTGLKNEYKAGIFLLFVLNFILLLVNIIDIYWVWFNFTWNGQYLKQFVHQGTYILILSILISIGIVLYYFRRNLNFYTKNSFLKYLSYAWLTQNAILAISVGIRNYWYIYYYSLAYKRIGVIIFLILTLYGLYSVFIKVRNRKTSFYLFRVNAFALYIVLIISSIINWDTLIARYNFSHAGQSYLHFDFVAELSDKALPYIDKPLEELLKIDSIQNKKFPNETGLYMNPNTYFKVIQWQKDQFKKEWEAK
jgi:hypothetical protein